MISENVTKKLLNIGIFNARSLKYKIGVAELICDVISGLPWRSLTANFAFSSIAHCIKSTVSDKYLKNVVNIDVKYLSVKTMWYT